MNDDRMASPMDATGANLREVPRWGQLQAPPHGAHSRCGGPDHRARGARRVDTSGGGAGGRDSGRQHDLLLPPAGRPGASRLQAPGRSSAPSLEEVSRKLAMSSDLAEIIDPLVAMVEEEHGRCAVEDRRGRADPCGRARSGTPGALPELPRECGRLPGGPGPEVRLPQAGARRPDRPSVPPGNARSTPSPTRMESTSSASRRTFATC